MIFEDDAPITQEQIAQHYSACMDSVTTINGAISNPDHYAGDPDVIKRNVDHLKMMVEAEFWTTEDLSPFYEGIDVGLRHLST